MKTLLVLRHAKSDWSDSGLEDHDRPLNGRGEREAPRVGELLRQQQMAPDLIITSDAVRARTTAAMVAKAAGYSGETRLDPSLYLASPSDILSVLRSVEDSAGMVMVVGHNPGLEGLISQLTGEPAYLATATLARILLPVERWRDLEASVPGTLADVWRPKDSPA